MVVGDVTSAVGTVASIGILTVGLGLFANAVDNTTRNLGNQQPRKRSRQRQNNIFDPFNAPPARKSGRGKMRGREAFDLRLF